MGDHTGERSLVDAARDYLRFKYQKPGNVFVGVVHRIDRPVSGVVLFARTSKGASRLSEQFRDRSIEKTYFAFVSGSVSPEKGELRDRLVKDTRRNIVTVDHSQISADADEDDFDQESERGNRESVLFYERISNQGQYSLIRICPKTGRSHQIRVQLSSRGWPIVGDRKYGSKVALPGFIALHAASLTFRHPVTKLPVTVKSDLPSAWRKLGVR